MIAKTLLRSFPANTLSGGPFARGTKKNKFLRSTHFMQFDRRFCRLGAHANPVLILALLSQCLTVYVEEF